MLALRVDEANQLRHRHPATASDLFQALPADNSASRVTLVLRRLPSAPLYSKVELCIALIDLMYSGINIGYAAIPFPDAPIRSSSGCRSHLRLTQHKHCI